MNAPVLGVSNLKTLNDFSRDTYEKALKDATQNMTSSEATEQIVKKALVKNFVQISKYLGTRQCLLLL